ncbi:MAG: ABC transporter ATP-binding protein [Candidatus Binatia bacterium]
MFTAIRATLVRFSHLWSFVAPFFPRLVAVFVLSLFGTVLGLLWPLFTKILIDDVLLAKNLRLLWILSGVMLLTTAIGYVVGGVNRYYYTQVTARILFSLRQYLFAHLQALSVRFHTQARVGDVISRLNTDLAEVQSVLTDAAFAFVSNIFVLCATVGFLLWLNWKLFLVSLLVVPLQLYAVAKVRRPMVEETRKVRELNASIGAFLIESLSAIRFIKLFTAEALQQQRFSGLGENFVHVVTRYEMLAYLGSTASTATSFLGGTLTTLYGGYLVIQGQLTIGGLVAFSAYQSRAFSPLQALMDLYLRFERAGVSLDRIFEFLDIAKDQIEQMGKGKRPSECLGNVEFCDVSFSYDSHRPVLQHISLAIRAGERVTIVGPSGTGKSTILDLLVRLYEPTKGRILLDGHEIHELDLAWLRNQIVVISPDPFLFHTSVVENLRYANPDVSIEEIVAAATAVGLHEFITSLPQGYDTPLGERGARLSAGQKQRVSLARAILKRPRVLVLDEAVSGLDVTSETEVRATLTLVLGGATTLVVTHRLSSLQDDDRVVVLENGQITWDGLYGSLIASSQTTREKLDEWEQQKRNPQSSMSQQFPTEVDLVGR